MKLIFLEDGLTFNSKVWRKGEECKNPPPQLSVMTDDEQIARFGHIKFKVVGEDKTNEGDETDEKKNDETNDDEKPKPKRKRKKVKQSKS